MASKTILENLIYFPFGQQHPCPEDLATSPDRYQILHNVRFSGVKLQSNYWGRTGAKSNREDAHFPLPPSSHLPLCIGDPMQR